MMAPSVSSGRDKWGEALCAAAPVHPTSIPRKRLNLERKSKPRPLLIQTKSETTRSILIEPDGLQLIFQNDVARRWARTGRLPLSARNEKIARLLNEYNRRCLEVERDPSLLIEIPQALREKD